MREPITRLCLFGPPLGIGLFIFVSPYAEIRFVYPSLLLLFACAAIAANRHRRGVCLAAAIAIVGACTGFIPILLERVLPIAAIVTVVGLLGAIILVRVTRDAFMRTIVGWAAVAFVLGCVVFVDWHAYLRGAIGYEATCIAGWQGGGYGTLADAWQFVRDLPPQASVAYANTSYTYPLYGFDLQRRVMYIPTRRGVQHVYDLPKIDSRLSGEQIDAEFARVTAANLDREQWLQRILAADAKILFIGTRDLTGNHGPIDPPELRCARENLGHFVERFHNDQAAVYEILRP